jgi:RNA polymerase sigma factor (sigma-70 family)
MAWSTMTTTPGGTVSARDGMAAVRARLHAFLARRVESPEVADDLTQEVLLRLLQATTHGQGRLTDPMAWLYRVARNVLIDHYRTRASHPQLDPDPTIAGLAEDPFADDLMPPTVNSPAAYASWSASSPSPTAPRSSASTSTDRPRPTWLARSA